MYLKHRKYGYPFCTVKPRFVSGIRAQATYSSIKISWSAPTTKAGAEMDCSHYYLKYTCGLQQTSGVVETVQTEFELSNLDPHTWTFFTIAAVYQEITGPHVLVEVSTGNLLLRLHAVQ